MLIFLIFPSSIPLSLPPSLPHSLLFLPAAVREREEEEAERVPPVSLPREAVERGRGREEERTEGWREGGREGGREVRVKEGGREGGS